jgi:hypothetical protein
MKEKIGNLVLKALGLLLLAASVLKGYELLSTPVANADIWSNRAFLIFTVEFELALGIWLLSGLFKQAAWLATLGCFLVFFGVTLYKGLTGAASCGCFGTVQVNPWITLLAVDLPAILALLVFKPKNVLDIFTFLQKFKEKGHKNKGQFVSIFISFSKVRLLLFGSLAISLLITSFMDSGYKQASDGYDTVRSAGANRMGRKAAADTGAYRYCRAT